MEEREERVYEPKDRTIEITESGQHRENILKKLTEPQALVR